MNQIQELHDSLKAQLDEARLSRHAALDAYLVLCETDRVRQRELVALDIERLMEASVVRTYEKGNDGALTLIAGPSDITPPADALELERELLARAIDVGTSLVSTHPLLDPGLAPLALRCHAQGLAVQVLLVHFRESIYGAFAAHWVEARRPEEIRRRVFYQYWDRARLALATASERERLESEATRLHELAFVDSLTGLPSGLALDEQLRGHNGTEKLSVLVLDFDGMREANSAFGYEKGGDVLIKAVGEGLRDATGDSEFPARLHRGGDEFAVILPGCGARAATARAKEIEAFLDALRVRKKFRRLYHGASVGHATRRDDETPGQTLGRAIKSMAKRKRQRRARRTTS